MNIVRLYIFVHAGLTKQVEICIQFPFVNVDLADYTFAFTGLSSYSIIKTILSPQCYIKHTNQNRKKIGYSTALRLLFKPEIKEKHFS